MNPATAALSANADSPAWSRLAARPCRPCGQRSTPARPRCLPPERSHEQRQIFQLIPSRGNVTYDDVWAATDMCDLLSGENRAECYASFGVDVDSVDNYLGRALCLEAAYKASPDPDEVVVHTPFGDARLHPPSIPDVHMPSPSREQAEAIAEAQKRVGDVIGALSKFHSELKSSARIMFD
eukprot:jgi/Ulvmu1/560/UM001_0568.1